MNIFLKIAIASVKVLIFISRISPSPHLPLFDDKAVTSFSSAVFPTGAAAVKSMVNHYSPFLLSDKVTEGFG